ncbi:alpha/beta fold hydrolase [Streptomyces sp. 900105755]
MTAEDTTHVLVDGRPVRMRISGPEAGDPVLLLHGIGRSLEDWQAAHDRLAVDHRVISIDHPGFGLSPRGARRPGLASFARTAIGVLNVLSEHRPVHVMGNSLGGAVAMTLAANHPERVATLVLADSAGFGRRANVSLRPMAYATLSRLPGLGSRFRPLAKQAGADIHRKLFFDPTHATDDMIRHGAAVARQADFKATFLATALSLGVPWLGTYPRWRRRLLHRVAAARIPTLVMWGDADTVLPPSHYHAALAALPHATGHLFTDTGHMPQIERTDDFVRLVTTFITPHSGIPRART